MNKFFFNLLTSKVSSISTDFYKQGVMIFILPYQISINAFDELEIKKICFNSFNSIYLMDNVDF